MKRKNLRRMIQFADAFPQLEIVATLSRQLTWSHIITLLPLKSDEGRRHYPHTAQIEGWSVRKLRSRIEAKAFELCARGLGFRR